MLKKIKYYYRIFTRKCIWCGHNRVQNYNTFYVNPWICRNCNKVAIHGYTYGMPLHKLKMIISKREKGK